MKRELIRKYAKESKQSEVYICNLIEQIKLSLYKEGIFEEERRFDQYLLIKLKKKLKINESSTIKSFKEFFKDKG